MTMNVAHFPLSGTLHNPTASDYALEATHLYNEAAILWKAGSGARSLAMHDLADRYRDIARRLSWVPHRIERERAA